MSEFELGVIVESDRDRRALAWLRVQVGDQAIKTAADGLAGDRRPFVSNIIKVLGLTLPLDLAEQASREIKAINLARLRVIRQQIDCTLGKPPASDRKT